MYFWNVKALASDLSEGKVTPAGKMKYFLVYAILSILGIEAVRLLGEHFSLNHLYRSLETLAITVVGTLACFQANQKGDGKEFVERFICLNLPILIRTVVFSIVIILIYEITGHIFVGLSFTYKEMPFSFDLSFTLLIGVVYYLWMHRYLIKVATAHKEIPATA